MAKKYNDNSDKFADWTTKKLKSEAISYDEHINGECACYGRSDLLIYSGIMDELSNRGIEIRSKIYFN